MLRRFRRVAKLGEEDEVVVSRVRHHQQALLIAPLTVVEHAHRVGRGLQNLIQLLPAVDLLQLGVADELDVHDRDPPRPLQHLTATLHHDREGREAGEPVVEQLLVAEVLRDAGGHLADPRPPHAGEWHHGTARSVHPASPRCEDPFVRLCGGRAERLLLVRAGDHERGPSRLRLRAPPDQVATARLERASRSGCDAQCIQQLTLALLRLTTDHDQLGATAPPRRR